MLVVTILALVGSAVGTRLLRPKVEQTSSGGIVISVPDIAGLSLEKVEYLFDEHVHFGTFQQEADGHWYHRQDDIHYNNEKLFYSVLGEMSGAAIYQEGILEPDQFEMALAFPPQPVDRQGYVVMRDDFTGCALDKNLWDYEVSMYGGYNWEIQVYTNDPLNVYLKEGHLYLKPTLTSDKFSESYLNDGIMDVNEIWGECTNSDRFGCRREGKYGLLPPVMSGKIKSKPTIRYGRACARARIPQGDWIWPAIWMLPRDSHYGGWPRSGEIDLMESRGNSVAQSSDGSNHGRDKIGSTLHWGPDAGQNKFYLTHGSRDDTSYSTSFHTYCVDWTVDHIIATVDDIEVMRENIEAGGFWQKGGFSGTNIWSSGTKAAPFDQPFYLILNVAIAGNNGFFPDNWTYNSKKPWHNSSPSIYSDFWNGRNDWLPSWQGEHVAMEVDWVELTQY